jgi:hypothetical protein
MKIAALCVLVSLYGCVSVVTPVFVTQPTIVVPGTVERSCK